MRQGLLGALGVLLAVVAAYSWLARRARLWPHLHVTAALILGLAMPASAQEEGLRVEAAAGGVATLASGDTSTQPWAYLSARAPLILGESAVLDIYGSLGLTSAPGETVDLGAVDTFRGARVDLGLGRVIGRRGDLRTVLVGSAGFVTRMDRDEQAPVDRFARHVGIGLLFEDLGSGALLRAIAGCDELSGPCRDEDDTVAGRLIPRHLMLRGRLPIPGTSGMALLEAEATLAVRDRGPQRDVMRVGVLASLDGIVEAIRR